MVARSPISPRILPGQFGASPRSGRNAGMNPWSQYFLAVMQYEVGKGVKKDLAQAMLLVPASPPNKAFVRRAKVVGLATALASKEPIGSEGSVLQVRGSSSASSRRLRQRAGHPRQWKASVLRRHSADTSKGCERSQKDPIESAKWFEKSSTKPVKGDVDIPTHARPINFSSSPMAIGSGHGSFTRYRNHAYSFSSRRRFERRLRLPSITKVRLHRTSRMSPEALASEARRFAPSELVGKPDNRGAEPDDQGTAKGPRA